MLIGLCGINSDLIKFGIQIVINEKINAELGTYILVRELRNISLEQLKAKKGEIVNLVIFITI